MDIYFLLWSRILCRKNYIFQAFVIVKYKHSLFCFFLQLKEQIFETMPCSAVTLSLATITAIVAVALLAIAFSTDNWMYIEVKRAQIHQVSSTVVLI